MTCTKDCHKPSGRQAHCAVCHRTFSAVSTFDSHRKVGVCISPQNIKLTEQAGVWGRFGTMSAAVRERMKNPKEKK